MSEHRVLIIENPACLRIDTGRLKIERDGFDFAFVSPKDIAVLCLEHHTSMLSVAVLRALAEAGAAIIVTDARHIPCAMQIPFAASGLAAGRLRQQITLDASDKRGELWQQLISVKLTMQAHVLRVLQRNGALRLERLATQVQHGDKGNAEGQGAKYYWSILFPSTFKRHKEGADDPLNTRLNYGYAVLRAMIARSLISSGLMEESTENLLVGLDHGCSLLSIADDVDASLSLLESANWPATHIFEGLVRRYFVEPIVQRIEQLTDDAIQEACLMGSTVGAVMLTDQAMLADVLIRRRDQLHEMVERILKPD